MAKTSSVYVDTTKAKTALTIFDNLQEELDTIKKLSNISGDLLIPNDFYNGCNASNLDIGSEANGIFTNYITTINSIKKYIQGLEEVNNNGNVDNKGLFNGTTSGVVSGAVLVANGVLGGISDTSGSVTGGNAKGGHGAFSSLTNDNSNVNGTGADGGTGNLLNINGDISSLGSTDVTSSDGITESLTNQEGTVDVTNMATGDGVTNNVNNKTSSVDSNDAKAGNGNINGLDEDISNQSGISQVAGNEVMDSIKDIVGNIVAVAVIGDDGHKIWYQVINGNVVGIVNTIDSNYNLNKPITILDNGKEINIKEGNYEIEQIVYNPDGSPNVIKIKTGIYSLLLHFDNNGNTVKVEYIKPQTGVFTINNIDYDIYDMYGNIIGKFGNGKYYIYETKYDQNGKVVAFKVSPNGNYEQWIYVNESTDDSEYSLVTSMQTNDKTNVSLFEKNKPLLGILGVLFVALGVTVAVKVIKNKKSNKEILENEDDTYEELDNGNENLYQDSAISSLSTGNYPIYDIKQDENGLITEARITPNDNLDEYWVEVW